MMKRITAVIIAIAMMIIPFAALAGVPSTYIENIYKKGESGSEVRRIQQRLSDLGYLSGSIDGSFGPKTKSAIESFQRANHIHSYESDSYGTASYFTQALLFSNLAIASYSSGSTRNKYVIRADEVPTIRTGSYVSNGRLYFTVNNPSPKAINGLVITYWITNANGKRIMGNRWRWSVWNSLNISSYSQKELWTDLISDYTKGSQIRWAVSEVYYENDEVLICDEANWDGYQRSYYTTYY